jgi:hypothetical protein
MSQTKPRSSTQRYMSFLVGRSLTHVWNVTSTEFVGFYFGQMFSTDKHKNIFFKTTQRARGWIFSMKHFLVNVYQVWSNKKPLGQNKPLPQWVIDIRTHLLELLFTWAIATSNNYAHALFQKQYEFVISI